MEGRRTYRNPVLRGFFPDPSIVRVGEAFYMANSSFHYFPAIPISRSWDLVNWEIIGHAVAESDFLDLSELADSHGIWAPDISYHEGLFHVYATLRLNDPPQGSAPSRQGSAAPRRRQILVRSERPEGPYSRPIYLDVDNIDPSLFVDDDGSRYLAISPGITLIRLSADGTRIEGEAVQAWAGTGLPCPEGPRVFKKDGWYYTLLAEGGTGFGHCVTVARSKRLFGPYEPCPFNPVLTQRDRGAPIQRCGHGQLVQALAGNWWMVYLCARMNGGMFSTLGRETALDPVEWSDDGWFTVNSGAGPSAVQLAPDLPERPCPEALRDDFDSPNLGLEWEFVRNPDRDSWSLTERPGFFRIWTWAAGLDSIAAKNTLVRREKDHRYAACLSLEFQPEAGGEKAGLACYYGIDNYIALYVCYEGERRVRLEENRDGLVRILGEVPVPAQGALRLKVETEAQIRSFFAATGGDAWMPVGRVENASFLSDEGVLKGKHHTGTMVGIFANNGGSGQRRAADFDWFEYSPDFCRADGVVAG